MRYQAVIPKFTEISAITVIYLIAVETTNVLSRVGPEVVSFTITKAFATPGP
jgi:hypothetical protein